MILADTLSHAYLPSDSSTSQFINHLESVKSQSDVRLSTQDAIRQTTLEDSVLMIL